MLFLVIEAENVIVLSKLSHFVLNRLADFSLSLHTMRNHSVLHDRLILHSIGAVNYVVFASLHSLNRLVKLVVTLSHSLFLIRCLKSLLWESIPKPEVRPSQLCFCLQGLDSTQLIWRL